MRNALAAAALLGLLTAGAGGADRAAAAPARHDPRLSAFLNRIIEAQAREGRAGARAMTEARQLRTREERDELLVPVILEPRAGLGGRDIRRAGIEQRGGRFDAASRSFARAFVPVARLRDLASHPDVRHIREPIVAMPTAGLGPLVSESVGITGAELRQVHGQDGAGVRVAVVDFGYIGLTDALNQGELNGATVPVDLPGTQDDDLESDHDHGTACAEHIADMAPAAEIHCIKVSDEVDLQNAVDYMAANDVPIGNMSLAFGGASYYDDTGPINDIFNESHDVDGVFWTIAAGNFADNHWRGAWTDVNGNDRMDFLGADERMDITQGVGTARVLLNWNQYGASITDLDLYVYDKNGALVASSEDPQTGVEPPTELASFFYSGALVPYSIEIRRASGPAAGVDMTLFSLTNSFEYGTASSSLMDPANAHGILSAAAIDQAVWALPNPPIEAFSSQGPTNDGRLKPDLAGPDGTTSLTYGVHGGYGTSFAAPTIAGAAVLLLQEDPSRTANDLLAILQGDARDVGAPGPDPVYGAGQLVLPALMPVASWPMLATLGLLLAASGGWLARKRARGRSGAGVRD